MSISPSSDLVLDVLKAANPASVAAATDRLAAGAPAPVSPAAATAASQAFEAQFDKAGESIPTKAPGAGGSKAPEAYRKFEAMVLQSFIKEMLPKDGDDVYGKGTAGDIWKGMLAQQIATVVSKRGGIGIADHLLAGHVSGLGLKDAPQSKLSGSNLNVAHGLVNQLQMQTFSHVMPVGTDETKDDGII